MKYSDKDISDLKREMQMHCDELEDGFDDGICCDDGCCFGDDE
jgi:hypothetical protein